MSKPFDSDKTPKALRDKIVGLGERSVCKSYFPQLQEQIEELKKSKRALEASRKNSEASEARLQSVFRAAPVGIGVVVDRRFQFVNHTLCEMLGYPAEAFIGQNTRFIFPSDAEYDQAGIEKCGQIRLAAKETVETRCLCRDGNIIDVLMSSCPIDPDDWSQGVTFTVLDITDRKKLEAELQQSRKMEAIGTLAGGIAHDFNNILSAIFGYAELSLNFVPDDSILKLYLSELLKAGTRARDLVKQILAFSRHQEDELSDIQLGPVIIETLKFLRSTLPSTIEIRQNLNIDDLYVRANYIQAQQVVMNLCTNSVQSMEKSGGVLEVILDSVELNTFSHQLLHLAPGLYVKLSVKDTGHGISPQVMASIFDPYFTTKKLGEGTGLGLSVVHGIIKTLGGEITVQSDVGSGTTFDIYLPAIRGNVSLISEIKLDLPRGKERILVVDDEMVVARTNQLRLEKIGYSVVLKTDSEEALELFRANPDGFDLVITDMTMPKMTGDALAVEMMKIRPGFPVILCTGYSSQITEEAAEKMGIRAFLMKPVMLKDLAKMIRNILDEIPAG